MRHKRHTAMMLKALGWGGDETSCERRQARNELWSEGHRGRGPGGPGGGRRLGRLFAHGDLHFVILHLIAEKPRHGYELIKAIEEAVAGAYSPSPGTIYPTLTMLEEQGYVVVDSSDGPRRRYTITDNGRAYLDLNQSAVAALLERMRQVGADHGRPLPPPVVRAVENLKMALRMKGTADALSEDQIRRIVETLDQATRVIEQS